MPRAPRAVLKLTDVLDFCFPEGVEHPKAATRLFLLCEVGPLRDGWLWGGAYNARRKLSEYEIETMVTDLEREDIVTAVMPEKKGASSALPPTPEQVNEILAGIPEAMKKPYLLRRPHIVAMLAPCSTEPWVEPAEPDPDARIPIVQRVVLAAATPALAELNAMEMVVPEEDGGEPTAPLGPSLDEFLATFRAQLQVRLYDVNPAVSRHLAPHALRTY